MLRIGQQRSAQFARAITSTTSQASRAYTTRPSSNPNIHSSGSKPWSPSATWVLGAGAVFTCVTLVAQSPALGLSRHVVFNDSNSSTGSGMLFSLPKIFGKPEPVKQEDIVLDNDLTLTSWKQQEQDMLIKAPGIMLWGSNKHGLVDPTGNSAGIIQIPQRLAAFQGQVLRDLKLSEDVAAAVDENGNVFQWGDGFNKESHNPELTLVNRNISKVTICDTKLYGLSKDGTHVYVLPKVRPTSGPTKAAIDYKTSGPSVWRYVGLGGKSEQHDPMTQLPLAEVLHKDERITSMASGKSHMVMVTSEGRVFGSEDGLSVSLIGGVDFRKAKIVEVACGEVHSLARDDQGRCWAWGVNGFGQLAQGAYSHANLKLPSPTLIRDISGMDHSVSNESEITSGCIKVAAGGNTSYFVIKDNNLFKTKSAGMGQWGQLGDGSAENKMKPIGIHDLAVGNTHAFAVLDNAVVKGTTSSDSAVHGRDTLSWGQNTFYQLLTGKRTNKTEPSHAVPLDSDTLQTAAAAVAAIAKGEAAKPKNTMDPRNRLQLPAAQPLPEETSATKPKKATKEEAPLVEVKIAAGNGVSAVYTSFV
ncbi:hypothetical protein BG006_007994 [Podila minutissima]|uniref:Uncharacterized protein n=1 Tax=Podila minutissima TaxID=64525 RepID=A0A9P5VKA0_9FUNG|nr:hypothetical protein BG006_007994 [Podila minutissima]